MHSSSGPATSITVRRITGFGGIDLAADVAGDPDDPAVILLHGGGQTRHAWGGAVTRLASSGWYAVSLDLRGHGGSAWSPDGAYDIDTFAADVVAVAGQFPTPVLVGASLGGLSALMAIGESETQIAGGLVLVDVTPRLEEAGVARIRDFMALGVDGFDSLEAVADAIASYLPHRQRPTDLSGLRKNVRQRDDGKWVWHWDPAFFTRIGGNSPAPESGQTPTVGEPTVGEPTVDELTVGEPIVGEPTAGRFAPTNRLALAARRVIVPTLLVRGGASDVVSPEGARELKELIPHSLAVDVAGAGHMVAGDRNDRFNDAVIEFLERVIRPGLG